MALQLKQSLSLTQQLIMTPQLQQAIKLLQQSRLELLETINQEMETNPMLEEFPPDEAEEEKGVEDGGNRVLNKAVIDVYRGDRKLATITPQRNFHSNVDSPVTEVALRSNLKEDLYVVLASLELDGLAAFQVLINPMVVWLWIGGGLLLVGTLIAAWPPRRRRR